MSAYSKLILPLSALTLAMTGCINDDVLPEDNGPLNKYADSKFLYLAVNLNSGEMTRADGDDDNDYDKTDGDRDKDKDGNRFQDGTGIETSVRDVTFLFYDANGSYFGQGTMTWQDGTKPTTGPKVEHTSKGIIAIENNPGKSLPRYMVTVLNQPGITPLEGSSITDLYDAYLGQGNGKVTGYTSADGFRYNVPDVKDADGKVTSHDSSNGYFVMSTTAFGWNNECIYQRVGEFPGATYIDEDDFVTSHDDAVNINSADAYQNRVVDVYVERLGCKVKLDVAENLRSEANQKVLADGTKLYRLPVFLAYKNGETTAVDDADLKVDASDVWIKFDNWGCNVTADYTSLVKDITPWTSGVSSTYTGPYVDASGTRHTTTLSRPVPQAINGWGTGYWNDYANVRSHWSRSLWYNSTGYSHIQYYSQNQLSHAVGTYDYCNENTRKPANILMSGATYESGKKLNSLVDPKVVTAATVTATICDENGNAIELIEYGGIYFRKDDFLGYIKGAIAKAGLMPHLHSNFDVDMEESLDYIPVDDYEALAADGKTSDHLTGKIVLALPVGTWGDSKVIYCSGKTGTSFANEEDVTEFTNSDGTTEKLLTIAEYNAKLKAFFAELTSGLYMQGFKTGKMYYSIPIEHLRAQTGAQSVMEGHFGVVRNHQYELTVTDITRLGHGIWDPDEPIIPENPDDPTYCLGARIHIAPWKLVLQNVVF